MSGDELERMSNGSPYIIELLPNPSDPNDFQNRVDEISYIHDDGVKGRRSPREINFTALPFPDSYRASMIGRCPQLGGGESPKKDDKRCQIYANRPILCANLPVGGDECNRRRKKAGFSPINQDGIVVDPPSLRQRIGSYAANLRAKLLGE